MMLSFFFCYVFLFYNDFWTVVARIDWKIINLRVAVLL